MTCFCAWKNLNAPPKKKKMVQLKNQFSIVTAYKINIKK